MLKAYVCVWSNKSAAEMVKFYKSIAEIKAEGAKLYPTGLEDVIKRQS